MSRRDSDILIQDMLESCSKINKYVGSLTFKEFQDDDKTMTLSFEILKSLEKPQMDFLKILRKSTLKWIGIKFEDLEIE